MSGTTKAKALVTGGAGFIGSNLVRRLFEDNWAVTVLDNLSSGYAENLCGIPVRFVEGDIQDAEIVDRLCRGADVVFHMAACVGRQKSLDQPHLDASVNLLGTVNVLEGMRKARVKRIVYSSSAAIFGELKTQSIDEDHPQCADSPYGVSKLAAEKMVQAYSGIYDITSVCLRYFNIYGVNQRYDLYGNVIPIFANLIYADKPLTVYGDGEQTRDFLNVRDVVQANILAATSVTSSSVYNLGSGETLSINQLTDLIQSICGKKVGVEHLPMRPADVRHCKANVGKVGQELGFYRQVGILEGLTEYLRWFNADLVQRGHLV